MLRRPRLLLALAVLALGLGCAGRSEQGGPGADAPSVGLEGSLTVLGAASLGDALAEVAEAFEERHPGLDVDVTADGSARLAATIVEGAPADVFAAADEASLAIVVAAGLAGPATVIATNELEIAVAEGNPLDVGGLADLARPDVVASLCAAAQPCGAYARQAFAQAGLAVPPAGGEPSVTAVLTRVRLGEADGGIVYATDVRAGSGVEGVALEPSAQVRVSYPAAVLTDSAHPRAAAAFLAFLAGEAGQAILRAQGFGAP